MPALLEWVRLNWILLAIILVVAAAFLLLKTSPTQGVDSLDALDATVGRGRPVVLEFYSNF